MNRLICGDCLEVLPTLPRAKVIWADPPDNIGIKYAGYSDCLESTVYQKWLSDVMKAATDKTDLAWLSYNACHQYLVLFNLAVRLPSDMIYRQFIWHFTFGQNRRDDFVPSYRPILRIAREGKAISYPESVKIPSARQLVYNDKRANPSGKMPDDVWEFPRVCGTHKERKKWHPCQHPKALLRRIVEFSTQPGDLVIDIFAGSGNMLEVCKELGRDCIGIDISPNYCEKIRESKGLVDEYC